MILNYGAKNFFCFKEGAEVSFEYPAKTPESITGGSTVSPVLCVNGSNASGKTNLLKILAFLGHFIRRSFFDEESEGIPFYSFFNNDEPSSFYLEFRIKDSLYLHELECTREEVIAETLTKNGSLIFHREKNEILKCADSLKNHQKVSLKSNASFISTLVNGHSSDELKKICELWDCGDSNLHWSGYRNPEKNQHISSSFIYKEEESLIAITSHFLSFIDPSIKGFKLKERTDKDGDKFYLPIFTHQLDNDEEAELDYNLQSNGTKILYNEILKVLHTLANGGCLVFDELDANLHPAIIELIIDLFLDPEKNPENAQLIFTSHNSEVLNMLTKYHLYLVEKENSESFAYRADDVEESVIRTDRPIRTYYEKNMLGGRPKLGESFTLNGTHE